jgi:hypothetical protein
MTPSPNNRRGAIEYTIGDATRPVGPRPKMLAHVCNDEGKWGKGFVVTPRERVYPVFNPDVATGVGVAASALDERVLP